MAEFALATARAAGTAILPHFRAQIDVAHKEGGRDYDPVTAADRGAEKVIRDAIARAFPAHGIEGEELGVTAGTQPYTWIVDPIDGTRSFILGQLHWATLIALNDGTKPRVGVVHQPFVDESFVAWDAAAQWRRGNATRSLATRRCPRIEDAFIATTDPRHFVTPRQHAAWEAATGGARMIRFGGDCYCYTQLAMGLVDVVIETGLKAWDVQALIPLIENAGGAISTWSGESCQRGGDVLACGDRGLHAAILRRIAG